MLLSRPRNSGGSDSSCQKAASADRPSTRSSQALAAVRRRTETCRCPVTGRATSLTASAARRCWSDPRRSARRTAAARARPRRVTGSRVAVITRSVPLWGPPGHAGPARAPACRGPGRVAEPSSGLSGGGARCPRPCSRLLRGSVTAAQTAPPPGFASPPLRTWQRRALSAYLARRPGDFLAVATPGAGKTTFALRVAAQLLADRTVAAVTVVTPTEHLKHQWALSAAEQGIPLDPTFRNADGATARDFRGAVLTYAQVAAAPALHRARTANRRTLVVLDEVHHAGDALSWGEAMREAFTPATRRLALTGTPFRSDQNPIPFVRYEPEPDGALRSAADHAYGYGEALRDGVVRPVIFLAYSGEARWRTRAGLELSARLGEPGTAEHVARAWRTALDPAGDWVPAVLTAANQRLSQVRAGGMPDAGGLVIATDHAAARAYAGRLREVTGTQPALVLSDDRGSTARIASFAASEDRWMVAVRMVSEGVDVPRLAVGVYATSASTPLYFAQAIGRFVRARRIAWAKYSGVEAEV